MLRLADDDAELKLAQPPEVVDEKHDLVGSVVLERHEAVLGIRGRCDHLDKVGDELVEGRNGRDAAVSALVVDSESDFDFVGAEVAVGFDGRPGDLCWA